MKTQGRTAVLQTRPSLRTRVLVALCVATIAPTVVVGSLAIHNAFTDVKREVVRGNLALIRALGLALDARLQDTRRAIETAATWWAYERTPGSAAGAAEATERHLLTMKREIPLILTISVLDENHAWLHGDPLAVDVDPGRLMFGGYIGDIEFAGDRPRVYVVTQARNRTGELVGTFVAGLDLTFARDMLQVLVAESRLGTGARLLIADGDGRLVARSDGAPAAGAPLLRHTNQAVARALAASYEGSLESDGVIAVYRNIASYQSERAVPWVILLEQPTEHAYALARKTVRDTVLTGAAVLALSLFIGAVLATRLTRPLRQLAARVDAVAGEGHPDDGPPAPVGAPGEIGVLARRFEDMARRVSEREKLQAALARGDRLASVGTMAASVAHEVNNPLTTVLGYAKLLLEGKEEVHPDRAGLQLIAEEAGRMKRIIGNLLDYSRSERAPRLVSEARTDMSVILRHTVDLLVPQLRRARVEVDMDLPVDLPLCAADPHALQQVFVNLVQNAAQAMQEGGRVTISGRLAAGGLAVEVYVTDEGPGIAEADRPRIFEPFFTTKDAGTGRDGSVAGTGLGLAVCKHLVTGAGGTIEVVDSDRGARFRVVIPVAE